MTIRPKRLGLIAKIGGNAIEIPLDKPCNFSVEPNGDIVGGLMVLANGENDINVSDYENTIKFERGRKFVDVLKITEDNTLLCLDDGAYLDGKVIIENCKNVKVCDLTVLDSCNWSI